MTETRVTVREIRPEDRGDWSVLWDGYNRFYEREVPDDITRITWARFLDPVEPMFALVAEDAGRLIGFAHIIFHRSTTLDGPTCYLQDLFTAANMRGQGVGRQLIEAVYARARQAGAGRVYWQTHETNATAMRLYDRVAERTGFVIYRKVL